MEKLIILVIWAIGSAILKDAKNKNNEGKTIKRSIKEKRKNPLSTFMGELEKEIQGEKGKQKSEQRTQSVQPARSTMLSDIPKPKAPSKPKAQPKPVGLEIDAIGGDEEIGGIKEADTSMGANNNLDLDLRRDLLKGIIYSEILSEPKSLRNMKRRG